jgi:hypothetical protein
MLAYNYEKNTKKNYVNNQHNKEAKTTKKNLNYI